MALGGTTMPSAATRTRRAARLVVVDDVAEVREALAALLRGAGHEVIALEGGRVALETLEREGADLVLTDLYMPDMTGWELVRAVRARGLTNASGLPLCVGLYSAVLSAFTREQLSRAQVDFAIAKLTDPEGILEAVERALAWAEVR